MNPVIAQLAALDGARIPGGCDSCDAYQDVSIAVSGAVHINVCHDDECPVLARHNRRKARRNHR